jgi:hypothetical protein
MTAITDTLLGYVKRSDADNFMVTRIDNTCWVPLSTVSTASNPPIYVGDGTPISPMNPTFDTPPTIPTIEDQCLMLAFSHIDMHLFQGVPYRIGQYKKWPRTGVYTPTNFMFDILNIPQVIGVAQCIEALKIRQLLSDPSHVYRELLQLQGVKESLQGKVREYYETPTKYGYMYSQEAYHLIMPFLLKTPAQVWF